MHEVKTNRFCLAETGRMEFTVNFVESTKLNQDEPHIHSDCEIYVNLSGDVSFEVEGRIYPVSRGTVIITRPYEYHHCIRHSQEVHRHFWITFSAAREDFLNDFFCREKGHNNRIVLSEEMLEDFQRQAGKLAEGNVDSLEQRIGVLRLFHILRNGNQTEPVGLLENMPKDVLAALLYMDEHLTEDLDIPTLAQKCGMSINTLERHFLKALGARPVETLRKKRLVVSLGHLRNGETVADAAMKSGFSDYSNFIQLFKKQFGMTPLTYKKKFATK